MDKLNKNLKSFVTELKKVSNDSLGAFFNLISKEMEERGIDNEKIITLSDVKYSLNKLDIVTLQDVLKLINKEIGRR